MGPYVEVLLDDEEGLQRQAVIEANLFGRHLRTLVIGIAGSGLPAFARHHVEGTMERSKLTAQAISRGPNTTLTERETA